MPWQRLLITAVIVIPIVWLLAYGFSRDPRYIQSPLIARQAPSFTLPLFGGGTIRLEDLRGKVVFLWPIITAKLDEALRGIVSVEDGRGDYHSVR